MRLQHCLLAVVFLVPFFACKSQRDQSTQTNQTNPADPMDQVKQGLVTAASLQAIAASASAIQAAAKASASGNVHSVGGELGTWDVTFDSCRSGELNGFYGVDLFIPGNDSWRVRYVHDEANGEVVKIVYPSKPDTAIVLDRETKCSILEGHVTKMNGQTWTPNGYIRHVEGHMKFDCPNTHGKGHVTGEATFSHCH
jgi:hypothetical protein